jgi:hypothetical protein
MEYSNPIGSAGVEVKMEYSKPIGSAGVEVKVRRI